MLYPQSLDPVLPFAAIIIAPISYSHPLDPVVHNTFNFICPSSAPTAVFSAPNNVSVEYSTGPIWVYS